MSVTVASEMHLIEYLLRTAYRCAITADLKERSHIDPKGNAH